MIAIKNADGTLVPVIGSEPGGERTIALSLVHNQQKRAEILLYETEADAAGHVRDLPQPEPFGKLVLRHLPDNPFGEVEIRVALAMGRDGRLDVAAETEGDKPVKASFRVPSAGLEPGERRSQMADPEAAGSDPALSPAGPEAAYDPFGEAEPFGADAGAAPAAPPADDPLGMDDPFVPAGLFDPDETFPPDEAFTTDDDFAPGGATPVAAAEPEAAEAMTAAEPAPTAPRRRPAAAERPTPAPAAMRAAGAPDDGPAWGQGLLRASIGLFAISVVELGVYFLLSLRLL